MAIPKTAPLIFAFTLFLSASLVFSVQPMLGKMMLPSIGGAPAGWAVAMFFFQTCLLCGYGLAYLFSKLPPLLNTVAIFLCLIPGALFLPITYQVHDSATVTPIIVFIQLTLSAAVPFLALSTLAPGLQRLFSFSNHSTAGDPYYLYAASNIGSFTGLLAYPLILEPLVGLSVQSTIWATLYGLLFICILVCATIVFKNNRDLITLKFKTLKTTAKTKLETDNNDETITWKRRFYWALLAAIPSSLMIGVTTEITTDIASAPLLWVIPLGLYLLTNIIAFSKRKTINLRQLSALHILSIVVINVHIFLGMTSSHSALLALLVTAIYLFAFTVTALTLHSQLANNRPPVARLTEFYFFLALGGALGGSFNALVAPTLFNDIYEFQAVLILSLLFNPDFKKPTVKVLNKLLKIILLLATLVAFLLVVSDIEKTTFYGAIALLIFFASVHVRTLLIICSVFFVAFLFNKSDYIAIDRNFFGVLKVNEQNLRTGTNQRIRVLTHGTTIHGFQPRDKKFALVPSVYYGSQGPVGDLLAISNPKKIAALGLGTGQLACHKKRGRNFTFYEIDPQIVDFAKTYFTALEGCGYKDIIIGDARLEIAKAEQNYDAIFVDTFSSDAIPVHLITTEAINLYFEKLRTNGYVAIHISNRHLDLKQPLTATAAHNDYSFLHKTFDGDKDHPYEFSSEWVVLTKNKKIISKLDKKGWKPLETSARPWTDDYSNYLSTFKILNLFVETEKDNAKTY